MQRWAPRNGNGNVRPNTTACSLLLKKLWLEKLLLLFPFLFSLASPLASPTFAQVMVTATRLVQRKCTSSGTGKGTTMYGLLFGARGFILNPHIPFIATIRKKNADITPVTRFLTHSLLGGSKGMEGQTRLCVASLSRHFSITMWIARTFVAGGHSVTLIKQNRTLSPQKKVVRPTL